MAISSLCNSHTLFVWKIYRGSIFKYIYMSSIISKLMSHLRCWTDLPFGVTFSASPSHLSLSGFALEALVLEPRQLFVILMKWTPWQLCAGFWFLPSSIQRHLHFCFQNYFRAYQLDIVLGMINCELNEIRNALLWDPCSNSRLFISQGLSIEEIPKLK